MDYGNSGQSWQEIQEFQQKRCTTSELKKKIRLKKNKTSIWENLAQFQDVKRLHEVKKCLHLRLSESLQLKLSVSRPNPCVWTVKPHGRETKLSVQLLHSMCSAFRKHNERFTVFPFQ